MENGVIGVIGPTPVQCSVVLVKNIEQETAPAPDQSKVDWNVWDQILTNEFVMAPTVQVCITYLINV